MLMSEQDLADALRHCRTMADTAEELRSIANRRLEETTRMLQTWRGPHAETFRGGLQREGLLVQRCVDALRSEADEWARLWADTVNDENRRRHEAAVAAVSAQRGVGEHVVDLFVGDDSGGQVRDFVRVAVPTASQRYAPTGELVHY